MLVYLKLFLEAGLLSLWINLAHSVHLDPHALHVKAGIPTRDQLLQSIVNEYILSLRYKKDDNQNFMRVTCIIKQLWE